jgi:sugar O-acyltransferase (sialic acid O-acetyltransferase NeuD family)
MTTKRLIIVGDGETAQLAYEYFTHDSEYEVAGFAVEKAFLSNDRLYNLPVTPFEEMLKRYPPDHYHAFIAVSYTQLNRIRTRLFRIVKRMGYPVASYISTSAFIWHNVKIGQNCFILENNVVQHGVKIADNVILWSGNHIGHQSSIGRNTYIASHVVVSGFCKIGKSCFLGVNCCLNDRIAIADDCIIGSGSVVVRDTLPGKVYTGNPAKMREASSYKVFKVKGD